MSFYLGKGMQIAGLAGAALALYVGMTGSMARELLLAGLAVMVFYAGRRLESSG